ncbi:hypothetical protein C1O63_0075 [Dehalococcoides mccartyi]|nr:hypothetical protein C1O63_0075 [Dehalococcoides mccartyi]
MPELGGVAINLGFIFFCPARIADAQYKGYQDKPQTQP